METLRAVVTSTSAIHSGAREISTASDDLSQRTEQQAASLEETTAALERDHRDAEEVGRRRQARQLGRRQRRRQRQERRDRRQAGGRGDGRDRQIVRTDRPDHRRDRRDRVPDQSAGAERRRRSGARRRGGPRLCGRRLGSASARATLGGSGQGDQGAHFDLYEPGRLGSPLVAETGKALERIIEQVSEINLIVADIAAKAQEQAAGLQEVNIAIGQMDSSTQQNATMVEESTAASHSLSRRRPARDARRTVPHHERERASHAPRTTKCRPARFAKAAPLRAAARG